MNVSAASAHRDADHSAGDARIWGRGKIWKPDEEKRLRRFQGMDESAWRERSLKGCCPSLFRAVGSIGSRTRGG